MPQAKITKRTVDAATPGERDVLIWDSTLRGFGLKVTPTGTKTYVLQYRMGGRESPTRRYTIGRHGSPWTPDKARNEADRLLTLVKQGKDPVALEQERRQVAVDLAFGKYVDLFIEKHARKNKSWKETRRIFQRDIIPTFQGRPVSEITGKEVVRLLDKLDERSPSAARHAHAALRKFFRWAVARGDITRSPMADMAPPSVIPARDRVLSDEELKTIWLACEDLGEPFGPLIRLLILTGQRRSEVAGMDWSEIDGDTWVIPADRTKNGLRHVVPLNEPAQEILTGLNRNKAKKGVIFTTTGATPVSGFSRAKQRLDKLVLASLRKEAEEQGEDPDQITLQSWRLHDIRRTVATGLQRLGIRLEVTEAVLNHVSGSRAGIVGVYQRHDWADEKRTALDAWASHIDQLIGGSPSRNVIALQKSGDCGAA